MLREEKKKKEAKSYTFIICTKCLNNKKKTIMTINGKEINKFDMPHLNKSFLLSVNGKFGGVFFFGGGLQGYIHVIS